MELSILLLILIAVIFGFFYGGIRYGLHIGADERELILAELEGQKLARKSQGKKYDELYDSLLRVNKYNKKLLEELEGNKPFITRKGEEIYKLYCEGVSRKTISQLFPAVSYAQICYIIRQKEQELQEANSNVNPKDSKEIKLI